MNQQTERRRANRQRVYLAAEIVGIAETGAHPLECVVRSISSTGANLRAPSSAPANFDLRLARDGAARRTRTIWVNGDQRGVAFEDTRQDAPRTARDSRIATRFA